MTESIQLKRARHALKCIRAVSNDKDRYVIAVRGLPAEIRIAGLGQALAMLHQREACIVYGHINDWFTIGNDMSPYRGKGDLLSALIEGSVEQYRIAVTEADAYLGWLKRFAEIFLTESKANSKSAASPAVPVGDPS